MTFYESITAINSGIALLLVFLIVTNPSQKNRKANQWLAGFTGLLFYLFFEEVLDAWGLFERVPQLELIGQYVVLSLPVLLLMVVRYFLEPERKWLWSDWLHFSLVVIYWMLSFPVYFVDANTFHKLEAAPAQPIEWVIGISFFLAFTAQTLRYTFVSYRKLRNHERNIRQFSADDQGQNLTWLRHFVIVFLFMFLVFALMEIPAVSRWEDPLQVVYSLGLLGFGYFAIGQPEVFPYSFTEREVYQELISEEPLSTYSGSQGEQFQMEKERLLDYMDHHRPFLDGQLNLSKLAERLEIPPRFLSQVINAGFNENFSSFINRYRTEYAQTLLRDSKLNHLSIYQIGLEAGFHSRTVFHTHFKKVTGVSPSAFRQAR